MWGWNVKVYSWFHYVSFMLMLGLLMFFVTCVWCKYAKKTKHVSSNTPVHILWVTKHNAGTRFIQPLSTLSPSSLSGLVFETSVWWEQVWKSGGVYQWKLGHHLWWFLGQQRCQCGVQTTGILTIWYENADTVSNKANFIEVGFHFPKNSRYCQYNVWWNAFTCRIDKSDIGSLVCAVH